MNTSTVSSLIATKTTRPAFFCRTELTKSRTFNGTSNVSELSDCCSSSETGASSSSKELSFPFLNGSGLSLLGSRLVGCTSAKNMVRDQPLKTDGLNCLELSGRSCNFLKQLSSCERFSESSNVFERDNSSGSSNRDRLTKCPSAVPETVNRGPVTSISCLDLVALMFSTLETMIILDCRNFMAYNANHIKGALNVNLANKLIRKRLVDGHVTILDLISGPEAKLEYKSKESTAVIVVYDDNAVNMTSLPAGHPLKLLTNRLQADGRNVRYLEGGLHAFQAAHQQFCQNPEAPPTQPLLYSPTSQDVDSAVDCAIVSELLPFLYVGNERDASNRETLNRLGITHILNVTAHIPFHFEDSITCKRLQATDSGCQNLKQYFEEAIEFIESARANNGRVLVHCQAGVSRSPTVAMAYLLARFGKSLQETFTFVHNRRSIISPNLNFMGQLLEFSQRTDLSELCLKTPSCECLSIS